MRVRDDRFSRKSTPNKRSFRLLPGLSGLPLLGRSGHCASQPAWLRERRQSIEVRCDRPQSDVNGLAADAQPLGYLAYRQS